MCPYARSEFDAVRSASRYTASNRYLWPPQASFGKLRMFQEFSCSIGFAKAWASYQISIRSRYSGRYWLTRLIKELVGQLWQQWRPLSEQIGFQPRYRERMELYQPKILRGQCVLPQSALQEN